MKKPGICHPGFCLSNKEFLHVLSYYWCSPHALVLVGVGVMVSVGVMLPVGVGEPVGVSVPGVVVIVGERVKVGLAVALTRVGVAVGVGMLVENTVTGLVSPFEISIT